MAEKRVSRGLAVFAIREWQVRANGKIQREELRRGSILLHHLRVVGSAGGMHPHSHGIGTSSGLSLAIIRDGKLLRAMGFGFADPQQQRPIRAEMLINVGSVTKP